ncbi:unnamed protein product [Nippostrongylus brasiliensis]|uniref:Transposase n=1 Tax=Nippostrongylus brasiliensis TaxID=27835 RepID=A0A0N4XJR2_NIPBR|nr:unnamed protein product [Nippostrongylus brasiliensis]
MEWKDSEAENYNGKRVTRVHLVVADENNSNKLRRRNFPQAGRVCGPPQ